MKHNPSESESGQVVIVMAFFLIAVLFLFAVMVDMVQVDQARAGADAAAQSAAVDGAYASMMNTISLPVCTEPCPTPQPRRIVIPDTDETRERVRTTLERNLQSVEYLMYKTTPAEVAANAEIEILNPPSGRCVTSPFDPPGSRGRFCDAAIAVRIRVPFKLLWGSTDFTYTSVSVSGITDDTQAQTRPTRAPTPTVGPHQTWGPPPPTALPTVPPCKTDC